MTVIKNNIIKVREGIVELCNMHRWDSSINISENVFPNEFMTKMTKAKSVLETVVFAKRKYYLS